MKLHEYQGKELLQNEGVEIPESRVAYFPEEAWMVSMNIGYPVMLKAQVLTGGRGKSGGVKKCRSAEEVRQYSRQMFGSVLTTHQSGKNGLKVRKILVEKAVDYEKEFYLSFVIDRNTATIALIISKQGGMEIENLSATHPESVKKILINPFTGFLPFHARTVAAFLDLWPKTAEIFNLLGKLYRIFVTKECTLLEVNPLVLTNAGSLIPLDIKIDIDDNALIRQKEILRSRDLSELNEDEVEARFYDLNFIKLDGNIGCMVNGAGLAMATMDFIKQAGGAPANFLDVGGVATPETISRGFEILSRDGSLKAIFVNIFKGIVRCDKVADGIIDATTRHHISLPVIIRLSGSNVEEGLKTLKASRKNFHLVTDVEQARDIINTLVNN